MVPVRGDSCLGRMGTVGKVIRGQVWTCFEDTTHTLGCWVGPETQENQRGREDLEIVGLDGWKEKVAVRQRRGAVLGPSGSSVLHVIFGLSPRPARGGVQGEPPCDPAVQERGLALGLPWQIWAWSWYSKSWNKMPPPGG